MGVLVNSVHLAAAILLVVIAVPNQGQTQSKFKNESFYIFKIHLRPFWGHFIIKLGHLLLSNKHHFVNRVDF